MDKGDPLALHAVLPLAVRSGSSRYQSVCPCESSGGRAAGTAPTMPAAPTDLLTIHRPRANYPQRRVPDNQVKPGIGPRKTPYAPDEGAGTAPFQGLSRTVLRVSLDCTAPDYSLLVQETKFPNSRRSPPLPSQAFHPLPWSGVGPAKMAEASFHKQEERRAMSARAAGQPDYLLLIMSRSYRYYCGVAALFRKTFRQF